MNVHETICVCMLHVCGCKASMRICECAWEVGGVSFFVTACLSPLR